MARFLPLLFPVVALAATAACHRGQGDAIDVAVVGEADASGGAAAMIRAATSEGLVTYDGEGHVVPALADRWIVTDDGLSYIFRLRAAATPTTREGGVTPAERVRGELQRTLTGLRDTDFGADLRGIEEVRAMAGRVIEIRLAHPMPWLLDLLAQPELTLVQRRAPGAMALTREGTGAGAGEGAVSLLTPVAPSRRGLPAVEDWNARVHRLRVSALGADAALAAWTAGKADVVTGGTFADLPRVSRLALGKAKPRLDPVIGLFGLVVQRQEGVLARADLREAIARAIDRDALAEALAIPGWRPTTRIVAPGAEGDPGLVDERWTGEAMADRQLAAARVIAQWRQPAPAATKGASATVPPQGAASLRIALPRGPGADLLFERLHFDLAAIGITATRVAPGAEADLALVDRVARYARPEWFLARFRCKVARAACDPLVDDLVDRAEAAPAAALAGELIADAEARLTQDNLFIPIAQPVRWSLSATDPAGFTVNRVGVHPLAVLAGIGR